MNWLHCFWGVGTIISPFIMAYSLTTPAGWAGGYRLVSYVLLAIGVVLLATLGLWRGQLAATEARREHAKALNPKQILSIRGVKPLLVAFFGYCALEGTAILWGASYLNLSRGVSVVTAARYASMFLFGITGGRFLAGFISERLGDRNIIRLGLAIIIVGTIIIWLPIGITQLALIGLVLIGLGCAPIYPAIIHSTPTNFGAENSQAIVGVQMAAAYVGFVVMPPLFGFIANRIGTGWFPLFLFALALLTLVMTERVKIGSPNVATSASQVVGT